MLVLFAFPDYAVLKLNDFVLNFWSGGSHAEHGHEKKSGGSSAHDVEKSKKGQSTKELHKTSDAESGGKKHGHHSEDSHSSSKKSSGGSQHGLKYHDGAKKKKANYKRVICYFFLFILIDLIIFIYNVKEKDFLLGF